MDTLTRAEWDRLSKDSHLNKKYEEFEKNVRDSSTISNVCDSLNITYTKITKELCNKVAANLKYVYDIKEEDKKKNTCRLYKYWTYDQMWKFLGNNKDPNHVKSVITDFLNVRDGVSKKNNNYSCQYYFHNKDFQDLKENLEKKFLYDYFKDFQSIRSNVYSKAKYDLYNKYITYIKRLYDEYGEECNDSFYFLMNNCDEYYEQDSKDYDPNVLLTTLKKYKGQTSDSNRGPSADDMPAELKALLGMRSTGGRTENLPKGPELQPPKGAGAKEPGSKGPAEPARPGESVKKPEGAESPAAQKGSRSPLGPFRFLGLFPGGSGKVKPVTTKGKNVVIPAAQKESRSPLGPFRFLGLFPGGSGKVKPVITKEQKGVSPAGSPSKTKVSEAPAAPVLAAPVTTVSVATRLVTTPPASVTTTPTSVTTTPTPVTTTTTPVTTAPVTTTSVLSTPVMSTSVMTSSNRRAPLMTAPAPKDVVKPDEAEAEEEAAECPDGRSGDLSTCVNALEQTKSDETVNHEVTVHPELTDIPNETESLNEQYLDYPIHVEEKNNTFTYNPESIILTTAIMFGAFYVFYLYYNATPLGRWIRNKMGRRENDYDDRSERSYSTLDYDSENDDMYSSSMSYNVSYYPT
ncbi:Plasmodium vivax Vir protein, putative [Plasmodium vivax]|nr:Plasmodium vivax Vir protein, putative [Plasmodium vivax]